MPDVKVYIRVENIDKWNAMANKSEWINTILANSSDTSDYGRRIDTPVGETVSVLSEEVPEKEDDPNYKQFQKDYSQPGIRPPHPVYGYPCCHKEIPCKHWHYREIEGDWYNELTKEAKDA